MVKSQAAMVQTRAALVQIEAAMIDCETTMLLRSHPIIAILPLDFRHYTNNIYRAVAFLAVPLFDVMSTDVSGVDTDLYLD